MRQFGKTARWFTYVGKDGCLWIFRHKDPITFEDNVDDWLLDGLRISSFTCGILSALWVRLQVAIELGLRTSLRRKLLSLLK